MNKRFGLITLLALFTFISQARPVQTIQAASPNKTTVFETRLEKNGRLVYRVQFQGRVLLDWSALGLTGNEATTARFVRLSALSRSTKNETFPWLFGERDSIVNHYNGLILAVQAAEATAGFQIEVRVFNGSVAFRYLQPASNQHWTALQREATTFRFTTPFVLYQYNQESVFTPTRIDTFSRTCDFPVTILAGKYYVHIGEAANSFFTKAVLKKGSDDNALAVAYEKDSIVRIAGNDITPWRTISVATSAIGLHAFSDLNYRLNPAPEKPVAASVVPGKLIRSQLSTEAGLECIDFAVKMNFKYIMFDAGWYGAEFRSSSDPTQVIPAIDMPKVIEYGQSKGIGVILYVNYVGLRAKLDTILPLYKKWGVVGMKFGFVDGLSQQGITWLQNAIRKVNDIGFILDIHDNYKPTGLSRTFPALFTQEGIRGDENSPDAFHTTVLPFTRFLAGPADFTFCYPNPANNYAKNIKVSKAQQLALTVIYYSPLQSIFWYGIPHDYTNEEEIEFFKYVPTVWNESKYLAGDIGKNISVARKKEDTWYIGSAAGLEDWNTTMRLDFLSPGKKYQAAVYEDGEEGKLTKRVVQVQKGDAFPVKLKAKCGQAVIITPMK